MEKKDKDQRFIKYCCASSLLNKDYKIISNAVVGKL